ncbi:Scs3p KNAG_0F02510 [Huiozyma naganishii CBS 8797]|uniref:Acyl-coenzyme A diphosphatase SCS3 n=1 Tax=Huiozyma naganishii (strain ATCC MYA-139 / BCRC 22969 / CBS 8797 / KCTC 17520 / NBRC 10181 / NCYC 3082 / Yp74L-3) TaxID=1071383 RepID=J7S8H1_HUIN7|nr:hypothetical protein KNAG_0F02510 [Kazachstania naganishii CBS 8797]CCK70916.1 hypothetical protein KNAG_0F02510 [Kazachstania naganishii CBS 8797]
MLGKLSRREVAVLLWCPFVVCTGHMLALCGWDGCLVASTKDSLLNTVFVKRGWFWTSTVFWWVVVRYRMEDSVTTRTPLLPLLRRYTITTAAWYVFTQQLWLNVPPLMDLVFVWSGGSCLLDPATTPGTLWLSTSAACRRHGGLWQGGHDPSGHMFLLSLMLMFLLSELPAGSSGGRRRGKHAAFASAAAAARFILWDEPGVLALALTACWTWALLVTAARFHTLPEQTSGLLAAVVAHLSARALG